MQVPQTMGDAMKPCRFFLGRPGGAKCAREGCGLSWDDHYPKAKMFHDKQSKKPRTSVAKIKTPIIVFEGSDEQTYLFRRIVE